MDFDSYVTWKKARNESRKQKPRSLLQKITDKIKNESWGYKIVHNLTNDEYEKFRKLYMDVQIWKDGVGDPIESEGSWKIFEDIAKRNKVKLDKFVDELHEKYCTDNKDYAISVGKYIVVRPKEEKN